MKNRIIIAALCLFASGTLSAQSVYPGQHRGKIEKETVAPLQVKSFDLKDIRLLPSRFRENMMRDSAWMASIDVNRLLHSFRTNAGVFAGREGGYMTVKKLGGWESLDCELRGHTAGHLLSAYGLMYAATGSEIFKLKGDSIVNGLASVQEALGNGYLSAFPEKMTDMQTSTLDSNLLITEAYAAYRILGINYVYSRTNEYMLAEDLVQDAFVRLMGYKQIICKDTVQGMFFTVLRNLLFDYLRRHYKQQEVTTYLYDHTATCTNESESLVVAADLEEHERMRLEKLPEKRRTVYMMSRFEDKSAGDIAQELNLSLRTVETHLYIIRKEIREYMRQCI